MIFGRVGRPCLRWLRVIRIEKSEWEEASCLCKFLPLLFTWVITPCVISHTGMNNFETGEQRSLFVRVSVRQWHLDRSLVMQKPTRSLDLVRNLGRLRGSQLHSWHVLRKYSQWSWTNATAAMFSSVHNVGSSAPTHFAYSLCMALCHSYCHSHCSTSRADNLWPGSRLSWHEKNDYAFA